MPRGTARDRLKPRDGERCLALLWVPGQRGVRKREQLWLVLHVDDAARRHRPQAECVDEEECRFSLGNRCVGGYDLDPCASLRLPATDGRDGTVEYLSITPEQNLITVRAVARRPRVAFRCADVRVGRRGLTRFRQQPIKRLG